MTSYCPEWGKHGTVTRTGYSLTQSSGEKAGRASIPSGKAVPGDSEGSNTNHARFSGPGVGRLDSSDRGRAHRVHVLVPFALRHQGRSGQGGRQVRRLAPEARRDQSVGERHARGGRFNQWLAQAAVTIAAVTAVTLTFAAFAQSPDCDRSLAVSRALADVADESRAASREAVDLQISIESRDAVAAFEAAVEALESRGLYPIFIGRNGRIEPNPGMHDPSWAGMLPRDAGLVPMSIRAAGSRIIMVAAMAGPDFPANVLGIGPTVAAPP
jgi:hypothetical protein